LNNMLFIFFALFSHIFSTALPLISFFSKSLLGTALLSS
jgi:hypothetical protein